MGLNPFWGIIFLIMLFAISAKPREEFPLLNIALEISINKIFINKIITWNKISVIIPPTVDFKAVTYISFAFAPFVSFAYLNTKKKKFKSQRIKLIIKNWYQGLAVANSE